MAEFFAMLGVSPSFELDASLLERQYLLLQQQYHPDRMVKKSDAEKLEAAQKTMDINHAYQMLKSPLTRAEYLLAAQGILVGTEQDNVKPSQALLMEQLELREAVSTMHDNAALQSFFQTIVHQKSECLNKLAELFAAKQYDAAAQETLKLRYLEKLLSDIELMRKKLHAPA